MNVETAIRDRKSVRAFKKDPVAVDLVRSVLDLSLLAPSWGNTQPWEIFVVTGRKLALLKELFVKKFEADEPTNPDFPLPREWPERCSRRYKDLGKALFERLGMDRHDRARRKEHYVHMFEGFGAPVFVYLCLDRGLGIWSMLDAGIFIQTLCLTAISKGLGSCILAHLVLYPDVVRKELLISDSKNVVMGIALGYPDESADINASRSPRESFCNIVNLDLLGEERLERESQ